MQTLVKLPLKKENQGQKESLDRFKNLIGKRQKCFLGGGRICFLKRFCGFYLTLNRAQSTQFEINFCNVLNLKYSLDVLENRRSHDLMKDYLLCH